MSTKAKTENVKKEEKLPVVVYQAVGKRKESSARVKLTLAEEVTIAGVKVKKGDMMVNGKLIAEYFPGEVSLKMYQEPFRTTNTLGRFVVTSVISGGGSAGQLGAFIHGASRALTKVDDDKFRSILKKRSFLTRDPRKKQRRKAGFAQKSRARKQSPKR
ncbi:MAG: 30S ribosomal protein S9 [Candidatus Gottesmanbacteria bacterium GW2011_GWA2_41_12]|uniref:30S ribosomal protein S9 n=1 Tax=Candidatus Gottesmanbacteria bacterium GW2011_GWA2_41_12 TaxID=1618440 RepID=A0A0G0XLB8_9BACT|nr:MAG: 30S ribosomal protein S9 [Candidatus Gottesmanbacteria bacterium GW2011_GWA2_41_12]